MPRLKTARLKIMPLILDLIGPFVVHFCKGTARIHAPLCDNHHANLLTDTNDIPLYGLTNPGSKGYVYRFKNETTAPYPAPSHPHLADKKLLVMSHTRGEIPESQCHLLLRVPYPDKVVPLLSEPIWIHRGNANLWGLNEDKQDIVESLRARGLRFIYKKCSKEPEIEVCSKPVATTGGGVNTAQPDEPDFSRFSARTLGYDEHYSITLRFASNQVTPDDYHQDAYCCFRKMRDLISDTHCWRVDFDDPTVHKVLSTDNVGGPHPKDCGASILLVKDLG
jgi:hypothetical protein